MAYLDNNGLSHLWSKIVNLFNKRIEVSETAPTEEENKIWLQPITTNAGAVDYIVDEGVSGIWTYRKWNSGIAECWGESPQNITTTLSGNGYYAQGYTDYILFPSGFFLYATKPIVSVTNYGVGYLRASIKEIGQSAVSFNINTEWAGTWDTTFWIRAIGKWK